MLPWSCPTFDTPQEAWPFYADIGTFSPEHDELLALAGAYITEACVLEETTETTKIDTTLAVRTEATCTYDGVTIHRDTVDGASNGTWEDRRWYSDELVVTVADGESWTRLRVWSDSQGSESGSAWTYEEERGADWDGAIPGFPDDGGIVETGTQGYFGEMGGTTWTVVSPDCSMTRESLYTGDYSYTLDSNGRVAAVDWISWGSCEQTTASIDGVAFGAWSGEWMDDPADADGDGFLPPCDCDDADPTVSHVDGAFCDEESEPSVDADGDGYTVSGDGRAVDCDDEDASVYPGAPEVAMDGIDQDCDGADAVTTDNDIDDDGYGAERHGGTDCEDEDAAVHPEAAEVSCDGVDQDCDGVDTCEAPDPTKRTEAECSGCNQGSPGQFLWLGPIALLRRRR